MTQMPFDAMQMLEYASLHEDSVPTLCFLRSCQKLMYFCGIGDFTIKDLTQPTSKRLKKHLSAVINFMKFKEERLPLFKELNEQVFTLGAARCKYRLKRFAASPSFRTAGASAHRKHEPYTSAW
jgi:hypothetical protein